MFVFVIVCLFIHFLFEEVFRVIFSRDINTKVFSLSVRTENVTVIRSTDCYKFDSLFNFFVTSALFLSFGFKLKNDLSWFSRTGNKRGPCV